MTFDQVLVFHKIIQLGSFNAASLELHKTQPAISLAIKKLEEELEVDLFDRSQYRPELTSHGKAFFEKSIKVVQGIQELENLSLSFRKKEEPEISIAIDGISLHPHLLKTLRNFSERFPNTKLNLGFDLLSEAERRVLAKEAQLGITHFICEPNQLEILPITEVRMLPVMSKELFDEKRVSKQPDLLEIDQIVVGEKTGGSKGASFGLLDGGKKWRLTDSNFKREVILAGLGWGHLPEPSIEREIKDKNLIVLNFEDIKPRTLTINLIRLKKIQLGLVAKTLWEELKSSY